MKSLWCGNHSLLHIVFCANAKGWTVLRSIACTWNTCGFLLLSRICWRVLGTETNERTNEAVETNWSSKHTTTTWKMFGFNTRAQTKCVTAVQPHSRLPRHFIDRIPFRNERWVCDKSYYSLLVHSADPCRSWQQAGHKYQVHTKQKYVRHTENGRHCHIELRPSEKRRSK